MSNRSAQVTLCPERLVQSNHHCPSPCFVFLMAGFTVYAAKYTTSRGTRRIYVGYSSAVDVRKQHHKSARRPAPLRASKLEDISYKYLEENLPSEHIALSMEAIHAARLIRAEPGVAHGGPWSTPPLSTLALAEVRTPAMEHTQHRFLTLFVQAFYFFQEKG